MGNDARWSLEAEARDEERRAIAAWLETLATEKHGRLVTKREDLVRFIRKGEHHR